ncbi:MAG: DUF1559 domain-containing protein [Armatimonadota bacterium]
MSKRTNGFTLIELLVVIAIIAILAAILFPVFARAREKARQTSCLSNVKQLSLGVQMYLQDFDETLPFAHLYTTGTPDHNEFSGLSRNFLYWMDLIKPYVKNKQFYNCPSTSNQWCSYGYNIQCGYYNNDGPGASHPERTGPMYRGVNMSEFNKPAEFVLMADSTAHSSYYEVWNGIWTNPDNAYYDTMWPATHNDGVNVGFVDGHAKWLTRNAFMAVSYGGSVYWFQGEDN